MAKSNPFSRLIGSKKAAPEAEPVVASRTNDNPDLTNAIAARSSGDGLKIEDTNSNSPGLKNLPTDTPSGAQGGSAPFGKELPAGLATRIAPGDNSAVAEADKEAADALAAFEGRKAGLLDQFGDDLGAADDRNNRAPEVNERRETTDRPSIDELFGSTVTTGADEAAANAVGQVLGGFGNLTSPGSFQNDPFIAASIALVDEQANSAATGPSVAADGSPLANAVNSVSQADLDAQAKALGITPPSAAPAPAAPAPDASPGKAPAEPAEEPGIIDSIIAFFKTTEVGSNVNAQDQLKEVDDGVGAPVGTTTTAAGLKSQGIKNLETAAGDALGGIAGSGKKDGGGVKDPGPDGDLLGPPTEAELAFRAATQQALGIRRIPGDIDPSEDAQSGPIDPNALAAAINRTSNESLVGQPGGDQGISSGGAPQGGPSAGNPQGTNIDPLEGDAFTGPSRGGKPSDLQFGTDPLLGLDDAARANDEEEEGDASGEDGDDQDDTSATSNTDD